MRLISGVAALFILRGARRRAIELSVATGKG